MPEKPPCYILFAIPVEGGVTEVRAICTEAWIANKMRQHIKDDPDILRCWVEQRDMNHMYGRTMIDMVTTLEAKKMIDKRLGRMFETRPELIKEEEAKND